MIPASLVPTFADDLYPAGALDGPPAVAGPAPVEAWKSFRDFMPTGLQDFRAEHQAFVAFRRTDHFTLVHEQIMDRVEDCLRFAEAHLASGSLKTVQSQMTRFRKNLETSLDTGTGLFAPVDLKRLYDSGKRDLDMVCQRLVDPAIDLDVRRRVLLAMADSMTRCEASGVAYERALMGLSPRENGLPGVFHRVSRGMFNVAIQAFAAKAIEPRMPTYVNEEVHVVEGLRSALGLGGDVHDRRATPRLFTSTELEGCRDQLRRDAPPVKVAERMAEEFLSELREALTQDLETVPPTFSAADEVSWSSLRRALDRLQATYDGVSDNSVLLFDVEADTFQIRTDPTLIARDLLLALGRLKRVHVPKARAVLVGTVQGRSFQLQHIDEHLFYEAAQTRGGPVELDSLSLRTLADFPTAPRWAGLRPRAVTTVLDAESRAALTSMPVSNLTSQAQVEHLLRRLGPELSAQWHPGPDLYADQWRWLLQAATEAGHTKLLGSLLARSRQSTIDELTPADWRTMLEKALAHGEAEGIRPWLELVARAAAGWSAKQVATFFGEGSSGLMALAFRRSSVVAMDTLSGLLFDALRTRRLDAAALARHLALNVGPNVGTLATGFHRLGGRLAEAVGRRELDGETAWRIINWEGANPIWSNVLTSHDLGALRWYHDFILRLAPFLPAAKVEAMLAAPISPRNVSPFAISGRHPEALKLRMELLVQDVIAKRVSRKAVGDMLACPTDVEAHGDWRLLYWYQAQAQPSQIMMDGVLELFKSGRLTRGDVRDWLAAEKRRGGGELSTPAVVRASKVKDLRSGKPIDWLPAEARLTHWYAAMLRAVEAGAIGPKEVRALLSGFPSPEPPLLLAMRWAKTFVGPKALIDVMCDARARQLLDAASLERLLKGKGARAGDYALTVACRAGLAEHVDTYLQSVQEALRRGLLPREAVVRLIDGRGLSGAGAGSVHAAVSSAHPPVLRILLEWAVTLLRDGHLTADEWVAMIADDLPGSRRTRSAPLALSAAMAEELAKGLAFADSMGLLRPDHVARLRARIQWQGKPPA